MAFISKKMIWQHAAKPVEILVPGSVTVSHVVDCSNKYRFINGHDFGLRAADRKRVQSRIRALGVTPTTWKKVTLPSG